jgi:hypothetical protein
MTLKGKKADSRIARGEGSLGNAGREAGDWGGSNFWRKADVRD